MSYCNNVEFKNNVTCYMGFGSFRVKVKIELIILIC
jgi:hypothetical protein